jgi:hypothetical protein
MNQNGCAPALREHSDVGGLSAGAVAAILSLLAIPGEYAVLNLGTTIALLLIIIAYSWTDKRTKLQSAALASVVALSAVPGMGFVDEVRLFPRDRIGFLLGFTKWDCDLDPCNKMTGEHLSRVPDGHMVCGWVIVFALFWVADIWNQKKF